jgi:hypothetical protein
MSTVPGALLPGEDEDLFFGETSGDRSLLQEFMSLRTLAAVSIAPFGAAAAILYGVMDPISFAIDLPTFGGDNVLLWALGSLLATLALSDTRALDQYGVFEKGTVGSAILSMLAYQFSVNIPMIGDYVAFVDGFGVEGQLFLVGHAVFAWLITAR